MAKEIDLPSGRKLTITVAPFLDCKALYQTILEELKTVKIEDKGQEVEEDIGLLKDLFCAGLSSKKIDAALAVCMKRSLYQGLHISNDTWEDVEARADYLMVCYEVAKENIAPFLKGLSAKFPMFLQMMRRGQGPTSETPPVS